MPVIKLALSLRRKLAAYATSSGKANRAIAALDAMAFAYYSLIRIGRETKLPLTLGLSQAILLISVLIHPGQMALTLIPSVA